MFPYLLNWASTPHRVALKPDIGGRLVVLWFSALAMERPSGASVSTFIVSPCAWKFSLVTCWWILERLLLTFCSLFSLCCFSSKIYLPNFFISRVSNSLERVGEGLPSYYVGLERRDCALSLIVCFIKWCSSSISMWHNLHILSSLRTPVVWSFSISSWWYDILTSPMATLSAFGKKVSRYFGRVINPNLEKCMRCSL